MSTLLLNCCWPTAYAQVGLNPRLDNYEQLIAAQKHEVSQAKTKGAKSPQDLLTALKELHRLQQLAGDFNAAAASGDEMRTVAESIGCKPDDWVIQDIKLYCDLDNKCAQLPVENRARIVKAFRDLDSIISSPINPSESKKPTADKLGAVLDVCSTELGTTNYVVAELREHLAVDLLDVGDFPAAEQQARSALEARRKVQGDDNPATAQSKGILATVLFSPNRNNLRIEEALTLTREEFKTYVKTLGPESAQVRTSLQNIATRCLRAGYLSEATDAAEELAALTHENVPQDVQGYRDATELCAECMYTAHNLANAEIIYLSAAELNRTLHDSQGLASDLCQIGLIRHHRKELKRAEITLKQAIEALNGLGEESNSQKRHILVCLAEVYIDEDDLELAESTLKAASRLFKYSPPRYSDDAIDAAMYLSTLARLESERGHARQFVRYQEQAIARASEVTSIVPDFVVRLLTELGRHQLRQGNIADAQVAVNRAADIAAQNAGRMDNEVADTFETQGDIESSQGNTKKGIECYQRALDIRAFNKPTELVVLSESEALSTIQSVVALRDKLMTLFRLSTPCDAADLYQIVWKTKGFVTRCLALKNAGTYGEKMATQVNGQLRETERNFAKIVWSKGGPQDDVNKLNSLAQQSQSQERFIGNRVRSVVDTVGVAGANCNSLDDLLPLDVAFVDIVMSRQFEWNKETATSESVKIFYEAFVVTRAKNSPHVNIARVELGTQRSIGPIISRWTDAIEGRGSQLNERGKQVQSDPKMDFRLLISQWSDSEAFWKCGRLLRLAVWQKLEPALGSRKRIAISGDFDFEFLPWAALPGAEEGKVLIEEGYSFAAELNGPHLANLLARTRPSGANGHSDGGKDRWLLVGALDYGEAPDGPSGWPPLVGSEDELTEMQRIAANYGIPETYTDSLATLGDVVRGLETSPIAVLSTHGTYASNKFPNAFSAFKATLPGIDGIGAAQPTEMLRSFLVEKGWSDSLPAPSRAEAKQKEEVTRIVAGHPLSLAGLALSKANTEFGASILTGEDVAHLNLSGTKLVVLSACQSGVGPSIPNEGTFGMHRAFLIAGAHSVVATIWDSDEEASKMLVGAFLTRLLENPDEDQFDALRDAQLTVMNTFNPKEEHGVRKGPGEILDQLPLEGAEAPKPRAHPIYWSQFILYGDWRPLVD